MKIEPNITIDRHTLELNKAYQRIEQLEKAIEKHRDNFGIGYGNCFSRDRDEELYRVLEEK